MSAKQYHVDLTVPDFVTPMVVECSPMLRWKNGVLEQLWFEKYSGKKEWRAVPTVEDGE